jgi:hypothetical protein
MFNFSGSFVDVIKESFMITFLVVVMMFLIEFINVQSRGRWNNYLKKKGWLQIVVAALLGTAPGCLGAFAAVSLYTHRILSFAALVTVMISTVGDEVFVMAAVIPKTTMFLLPLVFVIAIITGLIILMFTNKNLMPEDLSTHPQFHNNDPNCICLNPKDIVNQLKNSTFHRALLIFGFSLFIILLIIGEVGPKTWDWEKVTFLVVCIVGAFLVSTVSDHFLVEHVWNHIIKRHFIKVFLWTFGAFAFIHFLGHFIDAGNWVKENPYLILLVAVLVGIIPESGPHIVFITLFASGTIPFSILLANSIVQDGHGALPLLAESRKSFFLMKLINFFVGLLIGGTMLLFHH